ncbi:Lactoylglutathione lyase [Fusarium oxysporum f. sp. albedinis]|nr:Lactoylglutathione lyase [Fusarium oxysporum f. sp. albedinis]
MANHRLGNMAKQYLRTKSFRSNEQEFVNAEDEESKLVIFLLARQEFVAKSFEMRVYYKYRIHSTSLSLSLSLLLLLLQLQESHKTSPRHPERSLDRQISFNTIFHLTVGQPTPHHHILGTLEPLSYFDNPTEY